VSSPGLSNAWPTGRGGLEPRRTASRDLQAIGLRAGRLLSGPSRSYLTARALNHPENGVAGQFERAASVSERMPPENLSPHGRGSLKLNPPKLGELRSQHTHIQLKAGLHVNTGGGSTLWRTGGMLRPPRPGCKTGRRDVRRRMMPAGETGPAGADRTTRRVENQARGRTGGRSVGRAAVIPVLSERRTTRCEESWDY
jgi:hypothetical protein